MPPEIKLKQKTKMRREARSLSSPWITRCGCFGFHFFRVLGALWLNANHMSARPADTHPLFGPRTGEGRVVRFYIYTAGSHRPPKKNALDRGAWERAEESTGPGGGRRLVGRLAEAARSCVGLLRGGGGGGRELDVDEVGVALALRRLHAGECRGQLAEERLDVEARLQGFAETRGEA